MAGISPGMSQNIEGWLSGDAEIEDSAIEAAVTRAQTSALRFATPASLH
jgi:hypothetical protein